VNLEKNGLEAINNNSQLKELFGGLLIYQKKIKKIDEHLEGLEKNR